jgi:hypothetical protein
MEGDVTFVVTYEACQKYGRKDVSKKSLFLVLKVILDDVRV